MPGLLSCYQSCWFKVFCYFLQKSQMLGSHNFIIKGLVQNRKSCKFVGLPYSKSLHCTMAQGLKKSGIKDFVKNYYDESSLGGAFTILFFNEISQNYYIPDLTYSKDLSSKITFSTCHLWSMLWLLVVVLWWCCGCRWS